MSSSQTKASTVPPTPKGENKRPLEGFNLIRFTPDSGSGNSWDFQHAIKGVGVREVAPGLVEARHILITGSEILAANAGGPSDGRLPTAVVAVPNGDTISGGTPGLAVVDFGLLYNGVNWDRQRTPTVQTSVSGASPLTILAAGGGSVKNRIFRILIGSNNAGLVTINDISGGLNTQVAAGASNDIPFPPNGIVQGTANTAIVATLAGATLTAVVLSGPS